MLLSALLGSAALAVCPVDAHPAALRARVDESILYVLEQTAVGTALPAITPPDTVQTIGIACSGDPQGTALSLADVRLSIDLVSLEVQPAAGALVLDAVVNIGGSALTKVDVCGVEVLSCEARPALSAVHAHAELVPTVSDCALTFELRAVEVEIPPERVSLGVDACGASGAVIDAAFGLLRDYVTALVTNEAVPVLQETATELLGGISERLASVPMGGVELALAFEEISIDETGIAATLSAGVSNTGAPADCLPSTAALPSVAPAPDGASAPVAGPIGLAVSESFAQDMVGHGWLAGWFCIDDTDLGIDIDAMLPMSLAADGVAFAVRSLGPPKIDLVNASAAEVAVRLESVEIALELLHTSQAPTLVNAHAAVAVTGRLTIDAANHLALELVSVEPIGEILIDVEEEDGATYQQDLTALIKEEILPAFMARGPLPLVPTLFVLPQGAAIRGAQLSTSERDLAAALEAALIDRSDVTPPATLIPREPPAVCAPNVELRLTSSDDTTPDTFLRHEVWVDAATAPLRFGGEKLALRGLSDGEHTVSVYALDLNGNLDPDPATVSLLVDATPPSVQLSRGPDELREGDVLRVDYVAADNRAAAADLRLRYEVWLRGNGTTADWLYSQSALPDAAGSFEVVGLARDSSYRVLLFARDAVGNEGRAELSVSVLGPEASGCRAMAPRPSCAGACLLALVVARLVRRARSAR